MRSLWKHIKRIGSGIGTGWMIGKWIVHHALSIGEFTLLGLFIILMIVEGIKVYREEKAKFHSSSI